MSASKPELGPALFLSPTGVRPRVAVRTPRKSLGRESPEGVIANPAAYLDVNVDGRETSYFEWMGAGIYSPKASRGVHDPASCVLQQLQYGFSERFFYLRADPFPAFPTRAADFEFRIKLCGRAELGLVVAVEGGLFAGCLLDTEGACILGTHPLVQVAFDRILEVAIGRRLFSGIGAASMSLTVAVWQNEVLVDLLPRDTPLEIKFGADAFAWPGP